MPLTVFKELEANDIRSNDFQIALHPLLSVTSSTVKFGMLRLEHLERQGIAILIAHDFSSNLPYSF